MLYFKEVLRGEARLLSRSRGQKEGKNGFFFHLRVGNDLSTSSEPGSMKGYEEAADHCFAVSGHCDGRLGVDPAKEGRFGAERLCATGGLFL